MPWKTALSLAAIVLCLHASAALRAAEEPAATAEMTQEEQDEAVTALEISQQLARYQESLEALETEYGPLDSRLTEVLMDTARYYMSLAQFGSAATYFERALSIARVSDGLYSESQLPVLQELIGALKASGDWDRADDREHLALHIHTRLYEPGSQAYAEAVLAFGEWKIQAVRGNLMQRSSLINMRDIDDLPLLYQQALGDGSESDLRRQTRFDLLYGKAYAEAQVADYSMHNIPLSLEMPVQRYVSEYVCRDAVNAQGQTVQSCGMVRRENPQYRDYEMQRQIYRDRVQLAVNDLRASIAQLEAMVESDSELKAWGNGAAPARVEELKAIQSNIERNYRRSFMRW